MRIGIIGSGMIGGTLARLFVKAGHEVAVANSRGPESLADLVTELGDQARAATLEEAVDFGDPVFLAIQYGRYRRLPAELFSGKIVVDTMNYTPDRDGRIPELESGRVTETELIAQHLKSVRMVKAINTLYYKTLLNEANPSAPQPDRLALFVAGDDQEANAAVATLIDEVGFAPVHTGSLIEGGRKQQPGTPVFNVRLHPHESPYN